MRRRRWGGLLLVGGMGLAAAGVRRGPATPPTPSALSPVAALGRDIFFDEGLSGSGRLSCAGCHSPAHAYGPPDGRAVRPGGPDLRAQGARAVPSLRYLDREKPFGIGPDDPEAEGGAAAGAAAGGVPRTAKKAGTGGGGAAVPLVPQGGLFWDGRASTLQDQAMSPLFNPVEMANSDTAAVASHLRHAHYGTRFARLFGAATVAPDRRLIDEAMFAVARFEIEDPSFHPYSSKYDAYLAGRASLTPREARGLRVFEDPERGNCAACHPSRPGPDGRAPMFTDGQYEALGVPRNDSLEANRDAHYYDLGLCGPFRVDLRRREAYCGMFRTPSLRNVATRHVFFHNGVYHSLADVLSFYAFREVRPERIYPRAADGTVVKYDDLPPRYRGNVDTVDAPFRGKAGGSPPLSAQDREDVIAFLRTLTDGWSEGGGTSGGQRPGHGDPAGSPNGP